MRPSRTFLAGVLWASMAAALAGMGPRAAHAASFAVDSTADATDAVPGDGACATLAGDCTLRAAIQETNALPGADDVMVPAGVYGLSIPGPSEDLAATGDLDVTDDLTLTGAGAATTTVDAAALDRVLHISAPLGGPVVHISGLTFRNGFAEDGGGVSVAQGATLTLEDCVVRDNQSEIGGGLGNAGTATVIRTLFSTNETESNGGGIVNFGTLDVDSSRMEGNVAGGFGGGISNEPNAVLTVTDSAVVGNHSGIDAGIGHIGAALTLVRSVVSQNSSENTGGGIGVGSPATLRESTVSENSAVSLGGGIGATAALTLIDSTVSGNSSGSSGGGIAIAGPLTATNSTISGNLAANNGGGLVVVSTPLATLNNVTITDNLADSDGDGSGNAGGISVTAGTLSLANTIVAANADSGGEAPDCSGVLDSQGYNLIGDPAGCTLGGVGAGDIVGVDAQLEPLADNGGFTRTHALPLESPAIEAGSPGDPPLCEATDQRGFPRPVDADQNGDALCDIGSFEALPEPSGRLLQLCGALGVWTLAGKRRDRSGPVAPGGSPGKTRDTRLGLAQWRRV